MSEGAISRRGLLAGAVATGSTLALPGVADADAGSRRSTARRRLRLASEAELRLLVAWDSAAKSSLLAPPVARLARTIRDHEMEHHQELEERAATLGGPTGAVRPPAEAVPGLAAARTQERMLAVLSSLEAAAVELYLAFLARGGDAQTARLFGQIVASQGQHQVVLRHLQGAEPVPDALAPAPGPAHGAD